MLELIIIIVIVIIVVGVLIYATDYLTMIPGNFRNAIKFLWVIIGVLFILNRAGVL